MNVRDEFRKYLRECFDDEKIEEIISALDSKKFFKAPASTVYHLNVEGGLAIHSLNVCRKAVELQPVLAPWIPLSEVIITALFHDLNKIYMYKRNETESGELHKSIPYKKTYLITDDDSLSCYLLVDLLDIKLSPRMYNAIANQDSLNKGYRDRAKNLIKNPRDFALVLLLQTADMYASQIEESKFNQSELNNVTLE